MMARLIDADALDMYECLRSYYGDAWRDAQKAIDDAPTVDAVSLEDYKSMERTVDKLTKALADAEPRRHGHWIDRSVAFYRKCSECGCCMEWNKEPFLHGDGEYNYCPNCGAYMGVKDVHESD